MEILEPGAMTTEMWYEYMDVEDWYHEKKMLGLVLNQVLAMVSVVSERQDYE